MFAIPSWLTGIGAKIAAFGGLVLAILLAVLRIEKKGETAGVAKVEAKNAEAVQKAVDQKNQVETHVQNLPEGQAQQELNKSWSRD